MADQDFNFKYRQAVEKLTAAGPFELAERVIEGNPMRVYKHAPKTLTELVKPARDLREREFVIYQGERWTFGRFFKLADAISSSLATTLNIRKGDRVAIAMRNYPEWMAAFIAIVQLGAIAVPLNSWGKTRELTQGLRDAGVKAVFCDLQRLQLITDVLAEMAITAITARTSSAALPAAAVSLEDWLSSGETAPLPQVALQATDPAMIMYTSGTTGVPKGAVSTHFALCQAIYSFEANGAISAMLNPAVFEVMRAKAIPACSLLVTPLFHVSGLHGHLLGALRSGRKVVILYKWDDQQACEAIAAEHITLLNAPPSIVRQLLESELFAKTDTHSLFSISGGGAASPPRLISAISENVPDALPSAAWGMTETNAIGTGIAGAGLTRKPYASGRPHPIVDLRICAENGKPLAAGEQGEIWIKSPANICRYWNRPQDNARCFEAGWFKSGDIGYLDSEGDLIVCDRAKDMVIRGGENIYSLEVETVIAEHPAVKEVAAVAVPDERMGEELGVLIRTCGDQSVSGAEIQQHVAANLAQFKVPRYVAFHTQALPRNASGKTLKLEARQILLQQLNLPTKDQCK